MRNTAVAASLAIVACVPAMAQQAADHYRLHTATELARVCAGPYWSTSSTRLCASPASAGDHVSAIAFCHGVLAGAYGYHAAATSSGERLVCPPTPGVTRTQVANGFVAWLSSHPQYSNDGAVDALFRFAAEAYPCKR